MTAFLLTWYALGWVACGIRFAMFAPVARPPMFVCFYCPPLVILVALVVELSRAFSAYCFSIDPSKQYLWRKP